MLEHVGHRGGVALLQGVHLDDRRGLGRHVQLGDEAQQQLHRLLRGGDDEAVRARLRGDVDVFQQARRRRPELRDEAQGNGLRPGSDRGSSRCRRSDLRRLGNGALNTGSRSSRLRRRRRDAGVDGLLQQGSEIVRQGGLQRDDTQFVDRTRFGRVDVLDEFGNLFQVRRRRLDQDGVRLVLGDDADLMLVGALTDVALVPEIRNQGSHAFGRSRLQRERG